MRIRWIVSILGAAFLLGCAQGPTLDATGTNPSSAKMKFDTAVDSCKRLFGSEKNITPVANCTTLASVEYYSSFGDDWAVIAKEERAETLRWADEMDSGKLKGPSALASIEAIEARANAKRRALAQYVSAAQQAQMAEQQRRSAALLSAGGALLASPQTVTCTTVRGDPVVVRTECR